MNMLKSSGPWRWSPVTKGAVLRPQQTLDDMIEVSILVTKEAEVKRVDRVVELIDVIEPPTSSELNPQGFEALKRV